MSDTERTYAKKLTIGVMKKANIPLDKLQSLSMKSTEDLEWIIKLLNAMMLTGEPFTDDSELSELFEAADQIAVFLANSRFRSAAEEFKQKRSPKR